MLLWETDRDEITSSIRKHQSNLKIVLKTSDDPILLPIWLDHYQKIFLPQEIIIADNMSTDPTVLDLYKKIDYNITLFQYKSLAQGGHNVIHDRLHFNELFQALDQSSEHFALVDTDELLYHISPNFWNLNRKCFDIFFSNYAGQSVPTTWVHTLPGEMKACYIGETGDRLHWDIRWGKPFIAAGTTKPGILIHNVQFPQEIYAQSCEGNLFLLHLKDFSAEQRIRVNRKKLAIKGAINIDDDYETIIRKDYSSFHESVARYASEISDLLNANKTAARKFEDGIMFLQNDGSVQYSSSVCKAAMQYYLENFPLHFSAGFM